MKLILFMLVGAAGISLLCALVFAVIRVLVQSSPFIVIPLLGAAAGFYVWVFYITQEDLK